MDVAAALLHGEPLAVLPGLVVVASVLDDLRAEGTDRPTLVGFACWGTQMVTWMPNCRAGVGERLAVVPGRRADQTARALVLGEVRGEIDATTHLERTGGQMVLVLHEDLRADELREARVRVQGRVREMPRDRPPRIEDVRERRDRPRRDAAHGAVVAAP